MSQKSFVLAEIARFLEATDSDQALFLRVSLQKNLDRIPEDLWQDVPLSLRGFDSIGDVVLNFKGGYIDVTKQLEEWETV